MKYRVYKNAVERLTTAQELERLLKLIENDFDDISDRQYEILRNRIINKIYS